MWATAAVVVVLEVVQIVARPVGMAVEGEAVEGLGLGLQDPRVSAGCRECVRVSQSALDWQIEDGKQSGGRVQVRIHLLGR